MATVGKLPVGETFMLPWSGQLGKVLGHSPCGTKVRLKSRGYSHGHEWPRKEETVTLADSTECKRVEL